MFVLRSSIYVQVSNKKIGIIKWGGPNKHWRLQKNSKIEKQWAKGVNFGTQEK